MTSALNQFRTIAWIEGVSYLVLLFIAMPLKYMMGIAIAVKLTGWAHGVLFIAYVALCMRAGHKERWSLLFTLLALGASLVPFATFWLDRKLVRKK
ncbi:MAG TPA: hypothetical protein DCQ06_00265 [Myxococcales bacterium]|nr:hypothetical protein [Myxococcales bacterium]HAN30004.1 hypothetical protein [Myxococcales bacterium]